MASSIREIMYTLSTRNSFHRDFVFQYANKNDHLYHSLFDHSATKLPFNEDMILYTLDDYGRDKNFSYDPIVFLNGKYLNNSDYVIYRNLGSNRLYIKSSVINNFDKVEVIVYRKYINDRKFVKGPPVMNTDKYTFLVPFYNIGIKTDNYSDIGVFKRNSSSDYFKPLHLEEDDYSITKDEYNWIITINGITDTDDDFYVINKRSYSEIKLTTPVPVSSLESLKGFGQIVPLFVRDEENNDYMPLEITRDEELDVYFDHKKLILGIHYQVLWNEDNPDIPPVILFNGELKENKELWIRSIDRSFNPKLSNYKYFSEIDPSGIIDLGYLNAPVDSSYLEITLGGRKVSKDDIEVISEEVIRLKNQKCIKDCAIRVNFEDNIRTSKAIEDYKTVTKSYLMTNIRAIGFNTWRTNYIISNSIQMINHDTSEEYNIFKPYTIAILSDDEPAFVEAFMNRNEVVSLDANDMTSTVFMPSGLNYTVNANTNLVSIKRDLKVNGNG